MQMHSNCEIVLVFFASFSAIEAQGSLFVDSAPQGICDFIQSLPNSKLQYRGVP
jgi:hypothetical protein